MDTKKIKIAYIGGGSIGWAHTLMNDLALEPTLSGEVALYDIDFPAARQNERFGNRLQENPGTLSYFKYKAHSTIAPALAGADFVILSITPGPVSLVKHDMELPWRFGIFQTVGDTVGAGGILRLMRAIPMYEFIARQIARHCPRAWVINYTNPMTVLTKALTRIEPRLRVIGCCHEVLGTREFLAAQVARKFKIPVPDRKEIRTNVLGINHFTWIDRARWKNVDLMSLVREASVRKRYTRGEMLRTLEKAGGFPWSVNHRQITYELMESYGLLPAAGDRHLAEFVPGFTRTPEEIYRWGIVPTPAEFRIRRVKLGRIRVKKMLRGGSIRPRASGEEGVAIIRALAGFGKLETNINAVNRGQIENLALGAVVETNAVISKNRVEPVMGNRLPPAIEGLVASHVVNQQLVLEGAIRRDLGICFQAFANDPLMTLPLDKARELFLKMVKATAAYLPGYEWKTKN